MVLEHRKKIKGIRKEEISVRTQLKDDSEVLEKKAVSSMEKNIQSIKEASNEVFQKMKSNSVVAQY